jgi:magnesium chelatase family protein
LLDRIDLHVEVPALPESELIAANAGERSEQVRARTLAARARQMERQHKPNAHLVGREIEQFCVADEAAIALLKQAISRLNLSARGYHRVLRVARSIADLAGDERISATHVAEAVQYRRMASME